MAHAPTSVGKSTAQICGVRAEGFERRARANFRLLPNGSCANAQSLRACASVCLGARAKSKCLTQSEASLKFAPRANENASPSRESLTHIMRVESERAENTHQLGSLSPMYLRKASVKGKESLQEKFCSFLVRRLDLIRSPYCTKNLIILFRRCHFGVLVSKGCEIAWIMHGLSLNPTTASYYRKKQKLISNFDDFVSQAERRRLS